MTAVAGTLQRIHPGRILPDQIGTGTGSGPAYAPDHRHLLALPAGNPAKLRIHRKGTMVATVWALIQPYLTDVGKAEQDRAIQTYGYRLSA